MYQSGTSCSDASTSIFDRRIAKAVDPDGAGPAPAQVEHLVYDGDNIALSFDGTGTQTHRYLSGPATDQVLADETASGQVLWTLSDHQGTVRDLADSTGTILNHIRYDSFGNVTSQTNPAVNTRYGYTGRELDQQTGLDYYRARYYDPVVGRFISEAPIGLTAKDTDLYRYVQNNPINLVDPFGLYGRVVSQTRHIGFTNTGSTSDAEQLEVYPNGVPFIGLGIPVQLLYPPLSAPDPHIPAIIPDINASPPIVTTGRVIYDDTNAHVEYSDTQGAAGTTEPWGGRYTLTDPPDDNGHIIPRVLGGPHNQKYNFFSQNQSINRGGYRDFGVDVSNYLDSLQQQNIRCRNRQTASVDLDAISKYLVSRELLGFEAV